MKIPLRVLASHSLNLAVILAWSWLELRAHLSDWSVWQVYLLVVLMRQPERKEQLLRVQLLLLVLGLDLEL